MKPPILLLIYFTLFIGTVLTMISSHWLLIWVGLEMNMLAIIPILTKKTSPRPMEAATKYFLTQATASMILMMAIIINTMNSGQWTAMKTVSSLSSPMMLIALTMKLGMTPFHFWVPEVTQGISLTSGLILLTWQKLAPMSILLQMNNSINSNITLLIALLSIAIGGWGGLNQTQLRKILAFSSISHMGWMLAIITFNPSATILNLLIYLLLTLSMFIMILSIPSTSTLTMSHSWNKTPVLTSMLLTTLLSLGGLPPLSGFLPKWIIIQELCNSHNIITPTLMAIMSLLNLFFYMRLVYSSSLTMFPTMNNMKMKWQLNTPTPPAIMTPLITVSSMLLPLSPIISTLN
uniref:NADH-ubiquinone oxidoreductase chain 2 n=1 Tax=Nycticebus coucang insularis TaxID=2020906 RepID=A0A410D0F7_NYCCO|nr:NADH dehydrogenase subunit 2 [Nycticebus coucang insularis]QAA10663.1 NADH dehydrogenase subunit 2 [Nycticebus coucang insularis]